MERRRFARRAVLAAVILLNLAIVNVLFETRDIRVRYAVARKREAARAMALENRKLLAAVADARRPDEVVRRAAGCGVELKEREQVRRKAEDAEAVTSERPEAPGAGRPEVRRSGVRDPNGGHPLLR